MDAGSPTDDSQAPPDGALFLCPVPAPTSCPQPAPRYPEVAPIVKQRCVGCHDGAPGGPWPLTDYPHVADWWDLIRADLTACTMPPADGGVAMTAPERIAVLTWILCGFLP